MRSSSNAQILGQKWGNIAYWALWGFTLTLYLAWPLTHLKVYAWSNDEGLYVQRAALANAGYPLYTETFFNKPPLLVWYLQLAFRMAGETVAVARLACLCLSFLGFCVMGEIGKQIWNRWAGLASLIFWVGIPEVPLRAHVVMSDLPAMALALTAMAMALRFRRTGQIIWLAFSGAACGGMLLVHPLLGYTVLPLACILLLPGFGEATGRSLHKVSCRDLVVFSVVHVVLLVFVIAFVDWSAFLTWGIRYNFATVGKEVRHSEIDADWQRIAEYLGQRWTVVSLAVVSAVVLGVTREGRTKLILSIVWFIVTLATLLIWSPVWQHYMLFLLFPLAILVGGGLATAGGWVVERCQSIRCLPRWRVVLVLVVLAGGVTFVVERYTARPQYLTTDSGWSSAQIAARAFLRDNIPSDGFVATDDPFLAFAEGRLVPPPMTGASHKRIRSGFLTTSDMVQIIAHYKVQVVLLATERLEELPAFDSWVAAIALERHEFGSMWAYQLPLSIDTPVPIGSRIGSDIYLCDYSLVGSELQSSNVLTVTLFWELGNSVDEDYHVFVHLVDEQDHVWGQHDTAPQDLVLPDEHLLVFDPELLPGEYSLMIGMYRWPSLKRLPAFSPDGYRWPDDRIHLERVTLGK